VPGPVCLNGGGFFYGGSMHSRVDIFNLQEAGAEAHVVVVFDTTEEARDWAEDFMEKGVMFVMDDPAQVMH